MRQRQQRRTRQRRQYVQSGQSERIVRQQGRRHHRQRRWRLLNRHDAVDDGKARAQRLARPSQNRVPVPRLHLLQFLRRPGAVTQMIAASERDDVARDGVKTVSDGVNRGVGEARQRHRAGLDHRALLRPLGGDCFSKRVRWQKKCPLLRRFDGAAIEQDMEGPVSAGRCLFVKPLGERLFHRVGDRTLRRAAGLYGFACLASLARIVGHTGWLKAARTRSSAAGSAA